MGTRRPAARRRRSALEVHPVGVVEVPPAPEDQVNSGHKQIRVFPEYEEALDSVETLEHLTILYWMHELRPGDRRRLKAHPRGDRRRRLRGVFALRSPMRPNPIGVTTVRLVRREGLVLHVEGLDALDGAPVIDIKCGRAE